MPEPEGPAMDKRTMWRLGEDDEVAVLAADRVEGPAAALSNSGMAGVRRRS
jgi:hypothetical protein